MEENKKTAEEWEKYWRTKGLILMNYHGFGSSYTSSVDESFYTKPISLSEFRKGVFGCSIMGYPELLDKMSDNENN